MEAQDIYVKAYNALAERNKKALIGLITEHAYAVNHLSVSNDLFYFRRCGRMWKQARWCGRIASLFLRQRWLVFVVETSLTNPGMILLK